MTYILFERLKHEKHQEKNIQMTSVTVTRSDSVFLKIFVLLLMVQNSGDHQLI